MKAANATNCLDLRQESLLTSKGIEARMHPIDPKHRRIANIHQAPFRPFVYPDGVALGDTVLQLDDSQTLGVGFHVYRMPPGITTRGHRHNGHEQFLILEGELHESDGTILRAGDMVFYRDGTEHNSYTPNGCLLAVHIAGPETPVE
jgi:quercetin dioxygenase-like cupin family protein